MYFLKKLWESNWTSEQPPLESRPLAQGTLEFFGMSSSSFEGRITAMNLFLKVKRVKLCVFCGSPLHTGNRAPECQWEISRLGSWPQSCL